ncbi:MAG: type ISP restriction/modification enzyme [Myxococcota bacterium]
MDTPIHYRDFWGRADAKRQALIDSLGFDTWKPARRKAAEAEAAGPRGYETFRASEATRFRFSPQDVNAGYEAWPALDELFPRAIQGVNPNRGLDGSLVDTDREVLEKRMRSYFDARNFDQVKQVAPGLAVDRARYQAREMWEWLSRSARYQPENVVEYLLFPLDGRWIYYEESTKLLNERRAEYWENLANNEFLLAVPDARQVSETRPLHTRTLADLHVHDRGTACFPRETKPGELVTTRVANLAEPAWGVLRAAYGLAGGMDGAPAKQLVSALFRCALALIHAPRFEDDHRDALTHDWAHIPIPKQQEQFARLVELGSDISTLLDPLANADAVVDRLLGPELACQVGVLRSSAAGNPDLHVTISYFGAAKGRWRERDYAEAERRPATWSARTGDLYLSDTTFFANVPERVWAFELGGYAVLRKWLGYRQAKDRDGKPLSTSEAQHFRSMIQRLAALLALQPQLDGAYEETARDAFTAEGLGLRKSKAGPAG